MLCNFILHLFLKYRTFFLIVQLQKIFLPNPWKVNGNSKGVGGLKSQNFKIQTKNLPWEGYGYILAQHIIVINVSIGYFNIVVVI